MNFQVWTVMTNSALLTKVTNEHNKCESKYKSYIHTIYYCIYHIMIYTIIYPWFFVLSLIMSRSLPITAYIITTVELCMCVRVCVLAWLLTSFSYFTTALHFITWCQEWFSLRLLLAVLTSGMMFQPSWLETVVWLDPSVFFLTTVIWYCSILCKTRVFFGERRGRGLYISRPSPTP